jgi:CRISPR-associated protein Cas2
MLIVVAYDIADDRRRLRMANTLKDFGERIQFSVFECRLEADDIEKLRGRVREVVDPDTDRVRIYRLCAACVPIVEILGAGKVVEDTDVIVI